MEPPVKSPLLALATAAGCAALGCAHHKANQYAYAPPLAPPVYPQPQTATQPVAFPAPATLPPGSVLPPGAALPPGAVIAPGAAAPPLMPPAASAGVVPALADGSCPACPSGCDEPYAAVPVGHASVVQTPPCAEGP